jgi:hypothetical protein
MESIPIVSSAKAVCQLAVRILCSASSQLEIDTGAAVRVARNVTTIRMVRQKSQ